MLDKTVHGTDPRNNIHGNPPVDGQGNPIDRGIHGGSLVMFTALILEAKDNIIKPPHYCGVLL
jgi:hypothetical protein